MKTVFLGLYALGAIAYAVYAFLYCRRKNREIEEIYAGIAARCRAASTSSAAGPSFLHRNGRLSGATAFS